MIFVNKKYLIKVIDELLKGDEGAIPDKIIMRMFDMAVYLNRFNSKIELERNSNLHFIQFLRFYRKKSIDKLSRLSRTLDQKLKKN